MKDWRCVTISPSNCGVLLRKLTQEKNDEPLGDRRPVWVFGMTQVALTPTATADLRRLDPAVARRVVTKLHRLAENIETVRLETLAGPWQGVFKLRVGDYRVLYTREKTKRRVVVHFIRHRREVYKMKPDLQR